MKKTNQIFSSVFATTG